MLFYDWLESDVEMTYGPDDVIIGHLAPVPGSVMASFVACDRPAAAKILLQPFAFRIMADTAFILPALPRVDAFAAICGPYWIDRIAESPFASYEGLIQRVDMAVNAEHYPRLKRGFNARGKRKLLYIGHNLKPAKGCSGLSRLAGALADVEFGWIGGGPDIPHVRRISGSRRLTQGFMEAICRNRLSDKHGCLRCESYNDS